MMMIIILGRRARARSFAKHYLLFSRIRVCFISDDWRLRLGIVGIVGIVGMCSPLSPLPGCDDE